MSTLRLLTKVALPPGQPGAFDHGDVDANSGRVFVAHTDFGTVDVIDADSLKVIAVIDRCTEGSGVLCADERRFVFAASRGSGRILLIDSDQTRAVGEVRVGPKPNGLAYAPSNDLLLVADVAADDQEARLINVEHREVIRRTPLPGRPRWCVFDSKAGSFLVNIREPASLISLSLSGEIADSWPISSIGPHGLDIDRERRRAFVACDGGQVIVIDLADGKVLGGIPISGSPDTIWFNPVRQHLYVAVGAPGTLDVIDTKRGTLIESIATEPGAHTTAFDVKRQRVYVFQPNSCSAAVLEA